MRHYKFNYMYSCGAAIEFYKKYNNINIVNILKKYI